MEIAISRFYDPYLDNALQYFYRIVKEIEGQYPDVVECQLEGNNIMMLIKSRTAFIDRLEQMIKEEEKTNLYYTRKNMDGTTREGLKSFLPFLSQNPSQYPLTFREEERRKLLESAFPPEIPKAKKNPCFLCKKFPAKEKLTQGVYPFATKAASLTTATYLVQRSSSNPYYPVCPLCYLIGSLGWLDPAIPYLSKVQVAPGQSVSFLWLPYTTSTLEKLDELKQDLPSFLILHDERSNVKLETPGASYTVGRFSLLLAFLEKVLSLVAEKEIRSLTEISYKIPEEWWLLRIPEGRGMKNVDLWSFSLSDDIKRVLVEYLRLSLDKLYEDLFSSIGLKQDVEHADRNEERRRSDLLREELSRAFLSNDYDSFARCFQLHSHWIIILPPGGEAKLLNLIKLWRCRDMLSEEELEVLRKAGRTIALISALRNKPSVLYEVLDRVRTPSDFLDTLREIGHLLVGVDFEEDDAQYLSPDSLDQLVELVNGKEKIFSDIKNTLGIFISVEYAKRKLRERRQEK